MLAAIPTPFDENGRIDEPALEHIVGYLVDARVDLALLTEAAEDPLLSHDERRRIVAAVSRRARGRVETFVAVSAPSTLEAIELARASEAAGAAAVATAVGAVPGIGYRELYRHLEKIARSVSIPVHLVLRRENAADRLSDEEATLLAAHPRLAGVWMPGMPSAKIAEWARRLAGRPVLAGCALTFAADSRAGATGVVCGLSVIAFDAARRMMDAVSHGDAEGVRAIEKRVSHVVDLMGPPRAVDELATVRKLTARIAKRDDASASLLPHVPFALVKEALRLQGHPVKNVVRPPYESIAKKQSERLEKVLELAGMLA